MHRLAGRAAVGADAHRVQRPSGDQGRARRHGHPLRAPGARERASRARHDQPADAARGGGAARGERGRPCFRSRARRGAAHAALARPAEGGDADPRRVPDAGGARAACAGRGRPRGVDRDRRERRRRRAVAHRCADRRAGRGGCDVRRRSRRRRHLRRRAARPPPHVGGRRADRRHDARRRCGVASRADLARLRGERRAARGDAAGGARHRPGAARRRHPRDQAAPGAHPRRHRPARVRPHAAAADDPARWWSRYDRSAGDAPRVGGGDRGARGRGADGDSG